MPAQLEAFKSKYPKFAQFLGECFAKPECRLLPLESFLAQPLQRLTKYPLLLGQILKYTPESHPDNESLRHVLQRIKEILDMVNERTREVENLNRIIAIQSSLINGVEAGNDFVKTGRWFLKEGPVHRKKLISSTPVYLFLFSDLLVIARSANPLTSSSSPKKVSKEKERYHVLEKVPTVVLRMRTTLANGTRKTPLSESSKKTTTQPSGSCSFAVWDTRATLRLMEFQALNYAEKKDWVEKLAAVAGKEFEPIKKEYRIRTLTQRKYDPGRLSDSFSAIETQAAFAKEVAREEENKLQKSAKEEPVVPTPKPRRSRWLHVRDSTKLQLSAGGELSMSGRLRAPSIDPTRWIPGTGKSRKGPWTLVENSPEKQRSGHSSPRVGTFRKNRLKGPKLEAIRKEMYESDLEGVVDSGREETVSKSEKPAQ